MRGELPEADELEWERECLARAKLGDARAFAELYRKHAPRLYRSVLLPKLGDPQAAEDALAETFRTLMENLREIDADGRSVYAWLCRVGTNRAIDMHRKRARSSRLLCSFEALLAPFAERTVELDDGELRQKELSSAIERALAVLNPRYKRAIELRFLDERPREECASLLALKLGTFDVLLLRALRAFRREWEVQNR